MIIVKNVMTDATLEFDDVTSIDYALLYANCVEDNNLASWFFGKVQDNKLDDVKRKFKIWHGKKSISCGDWSFRKIDTDQS